MKVETALAFCFITKPNGIFARINFTWPLSGVTRHLVCPIYLFAQQLAVEVITFRHKILYEWSFIWVALLLCQRINQQGTRTSSALKPACINPVFVCVCVIMCVKQPPHHDSRSCMHVPSSAAARRPGIIGREKAHDEKPFHSIEITLWQITL